MKRWMPAVALAVIGWMVLPAAAQDDPPERPDRPRGPEFRQRMLEEFDKDGNNVLDEAERQEMRETMRERFGDRARGAGRPPRGERPPGDQADRPDRPGRGGPEGRRGPRPGGPPHLDALFEWFDADRDGALSRDEFHELAQFVQQRHRGGPPDGRRGPGRRGLGPRDESGPGSPDGRRGGPEGRRGPPEGRGGPPEGPPPWREFDRRGPRGGRPPAEPSSEAEPQPGAEHEEPAADEAI